MNNNHDIASLHIQTKIAKYQIFILENSINDCKINTQDNGYAPCWIFDREKKLIQSYKEELYSLSRKLETKLFEERYDLF